MKNVLCAAFIVAAVCVSTLHAGPTASGRSALPGGRYAVSFPSAPMTQKQTQKSPFGDLEINMTMAMDTNANVGYIVATCDFPAAARTMLEKGTDVLDAMAAGFVAGANGKMLSKTKVLVDGKPGCEIRATIFDGNGELHARICVIDGTVYIIAVMSPKNGADAKETAAFFESFQKDDAF